MTHKFRRTVWVAGIIAVTAPLLSTLQAQAAPIGTLHGIAWCESTDNPAAQNPNSTASGLFQFLDSTWAGYGGYHRAMFAPVSVQLAKALATPLSAWAASEACWGSGRYNGKAFPGETQAAIAPDVITTHPLKHAAPYVAPKHVAPKYVAPYVAPRAAPYVAPVPAPKYTAPKPYVAPSHAAPAPHVAPYVAPKHAAGTGKYHTVRPGDSLWRIAGTDWPHVYDINRAVIGNNPDLIYPGQAFDLG